MRHAKKFTKFMSIALQGVVIGVILSLCSLSATYAAVSPNILLVDSFSDAMSGLNSMLYSTGGNVSISDPGTGICTITYTASQYWYSNLWDGLHPATKTNLLRYTHIAFEVEGAVGGEDFYVGLEQTNTKKYGDDPGEEIKASDFIADGSISSAEYRTVRIPLNKFITGVNLNIIQGIDFKFSVPGSPSGTVKIMGLRFEGAKIDDFEDNVHDENLLLHIEEPNLPGTYSVNMDESVDEPDPNPDYHKLTWDEADCDINGPDNIYGNIDDIPGLWVSSVGFDEWNSIEPTDISLYTHLNMRVKGAAGAEVFWVEFHQAVPFKKVALPITNYITVSTNWQQVSIPLQDFVDAGIIDKTNMGAIGLAFGTDAETGEYTVYIDDIYLSYENSAPTVTNVNKTFYAEHVNCLFTPVSNTENDHLIFTLMSSLPTGMHFDRYNGLISWKPGMDQRYLHPLEIKVSDGQKESTTTINIDVTDSPSIDKPQSKGPIQIDRPNKKLLINGEEFKIKSIGYNPAPIGSDPGFSRGEGTWDDTGGVVFTQGIVDRDFPLLKDLRVNTIRAWSKVNYILLNKANDYGIKVCAGFWVEPSSDFTSPTVRAAILDDFKQFVSDYKDYPAILMWVLGNEVDLAIKNNRGSEYLPYLVAWYSLANEMAEAAYKIEGVNYHPVAISNADLRDIGDIELGASDAFFTNIDIWGMNSFTGYTFLYGNYVGEADNYFEDYALGSDKPLFLTEYDIDSFITTSYDENGIANGGDSDEEIQALWDVQNTKDVLGLAGSLIVPPSDSAVCIGGSVMSYSDEWWKFHDPAWYENGILINPAELLAHLSIHDLGGYSSEGMGNDIEPDNYCNEEYWGLFYIYNPAPLTQPDTLVKKEKAIVGGVIRPFDELRNQCYNVAPQIIQPKEYVDKTFYVGQSNGFYFIAKDANNDALDLSIDPPHGYFDDLDNSTGFFAWTPTTGDLGDHYISFIAQEEDIIPDGIDPGTGLPYGVKKTYITIKITVTDVSSDTVVPVAAISGGAITVPEDTFVEFDGSESWDNVGILNYQWDFSYIVGYFDGEPGADSPLVTTMFTEPGVYTVALMVNDGANNGGNPAENPETYPAIEAITVTVVETPHRDNVPYAGTIQDLINAAASNSEVYVWPGDYYGNIVMKQGISLIADSLSCVIKGSVLFNGANWASMEGFSINYPEGGYINLLNTQYPAPGLDLRADAGVTILNSDDVVVKSCIIMPDPLLPPHYGKGIQVWNMYENPEITPDIENNLIKDADTGIFLFSQSFSGGIGGTIHNNTLESNNCGIAERMHKENPLIANNIITNSVDGIHLTYEDGTLLSDRLGSIMYNDMWSNTNNVWCDEKQSAETPTGPGNISVNPSYENPPDDYTPNNPSCNVPGYEMGARLW